MTFVSFNTAFDAGLLVMAKVFSTALRNGIGRILYLVKSFDGVTTFFPANPRNT